MVSLFMALVGLIPSAAMLAGAAVGTALRHLGEGQGNSNAGNSPNGGSRGSASSRSGSSVGSASGEANVGYYDYYDDHDDYHHADDFRRFDKETGRLELL